MGGICFIGECMKNLSELIAKHEEIYGDQSQRITSVPPSMVKKYATGRGNANKEVMYEAFNAELVTPPDLQQRLKPKSKKLSNPVTDIVDAYFIAKWGWEGFAS